MSIGKLFGNIGGNKGRISSSPKNVDESAPSMNTNNNKKDPYPDPIEDAYTRGELSTDQYQSARNSERQINEFMTRTVANLNKRFGETINLDDKPSFKQGTDIEKIVKEIIALTMFEITLITIMNSPKKNK